MNFVPASAHLIQSKEIKAPLFICLFVFRFLSN